MGESEENPSALFNVIQIPSNFYFSKKCVNLALRSTTLKSYEEQLVRHFSLPCDELWPGNVLIEEYVIII